VLCSLLFAPCIASGSAVKRDISITKGMELAQLPAECVYYLLITEVLYERAAIKKEKERKKRKTCYSRCCGDCMLMINVLQVT